MDTILFDLDGTLLPMKQESFLQRYLELLGRRAAAHGYDPQSLVKALWRGTGAMMQNNGAVCNRNRFWECFAADLGQGILDMEPVFNTFYAQEFHQAQDATRANPLAREVVDALRDKGYSLALATNPLFPAVAIETRLSWVGLKCEDFLHITDYENSRYCKPHPQYFLNILSELGKEPQDCLMVGNSLAEDVGALKAGLQVYIITDCLEGEGDYSQLPHGSFADFAEYVKGI